jgi:hypothetical protein
MATKSDNNDEIGSDCSALNSHCSVDVSIDNAEWTKAASIELARGSRIKCQAFITRLVVVMTTAFFGTT